MENDLNTDIAQLRPGPMIVFVSGGTVRMLCNGRFFKVIDEGEYIQDMPPAIYRFEVESGVPVVMAIPS